MDFQTGPSKMRWSTSDNSEENNQDGSYEWDSGIYSLLSERSLLSSSLQCSTVFNVKQSRAVHAEEQSLAKIKNKMQQVHRQYSVVRQASHAVKACISSSKFVNSDAHIEAERILLASDLKSQLLVQQITLLDSNSSAELECSLKGARLHISNVEVPLKKSSPAHFVIICFMGSSLQVSPVITVETGCQFLRYNQGFTFDDFSAEDTISFRVFQLKPSRKANFRGWLRSLSCFKSQDVCDRPTKNLYYKDIYNGKLRQVEVLLSLFTLVGSRDLLVGEVINNDSFNLISFPGSLLYGVAKMETSISNASPTRGRFGFVSLGKEVRGYTVWSRKWCRLAGTELRFWDKPGKESTSAAKLVLDLRSCMHQEVRFVPPALSLEFAAPDPLDPYGLVVQKYLVATDSMSDFQIWKTCIDAVLTAHELKKILGCIIDV